MLPEMNLVDTGYFHINLQANREDAFLAAFLTVKG